MEISGVVRKGKGYGRQLGFPTANFFYSGNLNLSEGVYAGRASIAGIEGVFKAGIVLGPVENEGLRVEAHLISFVGDLYGKEISVQPDIYIRKFENFEFEDDLKTAIQNDLKIIEKNISLPKTI